jgi:hypothetical protein
MIVGKIVFANDGVVSNCSFVFKGLKLIAVGVMDGDKALIVPNLVFFLNTKY